MLKMLRKIISGGQTGADRAGLDFAIEADMAVLAHRKVRRSMFTMAGHSAGGVLNRK
jgi:hypothetical protein